MMMLCCPCKHTEHSGLHTLPPFFNLPYLPSHPSSLPSVHVQCWAFGQDLPKPSLQPNYILCPNSFIIELHAVTANSACG